jgi:hypothetical protein
MQGKDHGNQESHEDSGLVENVDSELSMEPIGVLTGSKLKHGPSMCNKTVFQQILVDNILHRLIFIARLRQAALSFHSKVTH